MITVKEKILKNFILLKSFYIHPIWNDLQFKLLIFFPWCGIDKF